MREVTVKLPEHMVELVEGLSRHHDRHFDEMVASMINVAVCMYTAYWFPEKAPELLQGERETVIPIRDCLLKVFPMEEGDA